MVRPEILTISGKIKLIDANSAIRNAVIYKTATIETTF